METRNKKKKFLNKINESNNPSLNASNNESPKKNKKSRKLQVERY